MRDDPIETGLPSQHAEDQGVEQCPIGSPQALQPVVGFAGEGVRLARCKTLDLSVPSHSELVLEGTITGSFWR